MIRRWLQAIKLLLRFPVRYGFKQVDELPSKLRKYTIYLEQHLGYPWRAAMDCPCGCGQVLYLNLLREHSPNWKYKTTRKTISLSPSIHRTVGCKSHFFITDGKLIWCK